MRNLPLNVLGIINKSFNHLKEHHLIKYYKRYYNIYHSEYALESFEHMEDDPRKLSESEKEVKNKKYFECVI